MSQAFCELALAGFQTPTGIEPTVVDDDDDGFQWIAVSSFDGLHCVQDPDASYDINGLDSDPMPRYDAADDNR